MQLDTTKECAAKLKVSPSTVYRMVARGDIRQERHTVIGNQRRFNTDGIIEDMLAKDCPLPKNP